MLYHLFQLSIVLNYFYRQLKELMYQYGLMNAIHEHWKENEPIRWVLIDHYLLNEQILHKPIFEKKKETFVLVNLFLHLLEVPFRQHHEKDQQRIQLHFFH